MTKSDAIELASKMADVRPDPAWNLTGFQAWELSVLALWQTCDQLTRDRYGNRLLNYDNWIKCAGYICCPPDSYEMEARKVAHIY